MVDVSSGGRTEPQRSEAVVVVEDDCDAGMVTFAEAKYYVDIFAGLIRNSSVNLRSLASIPLLEVFSFLIRSHQIPWDSDVASVKCEIFDSIALSVESVMGSSHEKQLQTLMGDAAMETSPAEFVVAILQRMHDMRATLSMVVKIAHLLHVYKGCFNNKLRSLLSKSFTGVCVDGWLQPSYLFCSPPNGEKLILAFALCLCSCHCYFLAWI